MHFPSLFAILATASVSAFQSRSAVYVSFGVQPESLSTLGKQICSVEITESPSLTGFVLRSETLARRRVDWVWFLAADVFSPKSFHHVLLCDVTIHIVAFLCAQQQGDDAFTAKCLDFSTVDLRDTKIISP